MKGQIRDLSSAIGAVVGGVVGDSASNVQIGGLIGQNAVENNGLENVLLPHEIDEIVNDKDGQTIKDTVDAAKAYR